MIILAYPTDFLKFHNKVKVKKQTPLTVLSVVLWTFSFHFMLNIYIGSTQISRAHMDNFLLYHSHSTVLCSCDNPETYTSPVRDFHYPSIVFEVNQWV